MTLLWANMLGPSFAYFYLLAARTRGGILVAWHTGKWCCSNVHLSDHAVTIKMRHCSGEDTWWFTTIYGLQDDQEKVAFLEVLRQLHAGHPGPWILCGDFNLIYKAMDKSNGRLNHCLMARVRRFLQDLELLELHLHGHSYTWSNEQAHPTLVRIDRAFACADLCERFPFHRLHALSLACSDHAPLLLHTDTAHTFHRRFMFESIWPKFPGYLDAVAAGWNYPVHNVDAFCMLDFKFQNTTWALKSWSQKFIGSIRFQLGVPKEVIFQLERAQKSRALSAEEQVLRRELKFKWLGLASLNRSIIHQRSRLTFLKEGGMNTKFFHLQACNRGRKSFIDRLHHKGETVVHELDKALIVFYHVDAILGSSVKRSCALDLGMLNMPLIDLSGLDVCFSEDEIWKVNRALPLDRAPGLDGFMGLFFQTPWPIIKYDIMQALHAF
jgi:hypothetical protein